MVRVKLDQKNTDYLNYQHISKSSRKINPTFRLYIQYAIKKEFHFSR